MNFAFHYLRISKCWRLVNLSDRTQHCAFHYFWISKSWQGMSTSLTGNRPGFEPDLIYNIKKSNTEVGWRLSPRLRDSPLGEGGVSHNLTRLLLPNSAFSQWYTFKFDWRKRINILTSQTFDWRFQGYSPPYIQQVRLWTIEHLSRSHPPGKKIARHWNDCPGNHFVCPSPTMLGCWMGLCHVW